MSAEDSSRREGLKVRQRSERTAGDKRRKHDSSRTPIGQEEDQGLRARPAGELEERREQHPDTGFWGQRLFS